MATPSIPALLKTADENASAKLVERTSGAAPPKENRKGFPRWIFFALIGFLGVAAAVACLLFLRHRNMGQHGASAGSSPANRTDPKAAPHARTVELPLDSFVVNLADTGGHSYARIGLTLQIVPPSAGDGKSEKKEGAAAGGSGPRDILRDTIITVLNQEQSADLLAPGGKENLKRSIRVAIAARDPQVEVSDIYFTEFLIQQ